MLFRSMDHGIAAYRVAVHEERDAACISAEQRQQRQRARNAIMSKSRKVHFRRKYSAFRAREQVFYSAEERIGILNGYYVGWDSIQFPVYRNGKLWNDGRSIRAAACGSPTAEDETSLVRVAVRRSGAAANCAVRRTAIFICVSINRGRNDLGKKAVAATERKKSETF